MIIKIVMGDPGRHNDPFAIVGIEYDTETKNIYPKLARQFVRSKYGIVAEFLLAVKKSQRPNFMGLETNNRGGNVLKLFETKYNLKMNGVYTGFDLNEETMLKGKSMDKPYMIKWFKENIDRVIFPEVRSADMSELLNQMNQIVGIRTASGHMMYKAQRGRHDDLFMALLLSLHIVMVHEKREGLS